MFTFFGPLKFSNFFGKHITFSFENQTFSVLYGIQDMKKSGFQMFPFVGDQILDGTY